MGGGTNLIVSDRGFRGIVLRYRAHSLHAANNRVMADSGAVLQDLVDFTVAHGLRGLETLAGIPGSVGAAVYGNAGAYGHSISERVVSVRFYDGAAVRVFNNEECRFQYRESIFKQYGLDHFFHRTAPEPAEAEILRQISGDIVKVRNEKFPVTMKCAGSIFKNLLLKELPPAGPRTGSGIGGARRQGARGLVSGTGGRRRACGAAIFIHATYHANLILQCRRRHRPRTLRADSGIEGTAVRERFGMELEEEVQYVG
jgi:UDP-N-acetylmuramate dehydrogenase